MKRITLRLEPKLGWLADFHDDVEVLAAFGCTLIQTAYTARARPGFVLTAISKLNPGAVVEVQS